MGLQVLLQADATSHGMDRTSGAIYHWRLIRAFALRTPATYRTLANSDLCRL